MSKIQDTYTDSFTDYTTSVRVGEYDIKFPPMPNKKDIINYGLPLEKQVFRRTTYEINNKHYYASDLIGDLWTYLPDNRKKEIFNTEWERRRNGLWYYINGRTIFINGFNYYFLNYFKLDGINCPQWWDSQWFYNLLLEDSFYADNTLALMYVKGRRGGGSAPNNSACGNVGTGFKNSLCGIMNYNEEQALKVNFSPIRQSILQHPDFFLPEPYLSARAKGQAALKKEKTERELKFPDVNCNIYVGATKEEGFDGTLQRFSVIDEPYKWKNTNPMVTLEKNSLCIKDGGIKTNIKDPITGEIIKSAGLSVYVSSVDEINDEQIQVVNDMWDVCSPETATRTWASTYGARRYFESSAFGLKGYIDKFGFSKFKEATAYIEEEYENTLKNAGYDKAREFKRKNPLCIEDSLTPSSQVCMFNFVILEEALRNAKNIPKDDPRKPICYDLRWVVPYKEVIAIPKPNIKEVCEEAPFLISGHPDKPNNIDTTSDIIRPLNKGSFLVSLDPVDYNLKSLNKGTKGSKPGLSVKALLDMAKDGDKFDKDGNPINKGHGFETNRTVLSTMYRPKEIEDLWEMIAKVLVYYGAPIAHERSTRSIYDFLVRVGMKKFILDGKGEVITEKTKDDFGIKTQTETKKNYFDCTNTHIERYGLAETHIEIIEQLIVVRPETMTKFDIATSKMIGEYVDNMNTAKYKKKTSTSSIWENFKA